MADFRLTATAAADIIDILTWSQTQFGETARRRYQRLIVAGLSDVAADPFRPGSIARSELGKEVRSWHLRGSRQHAKDVDGIVLHPRHFLVYRPFTPLLVIGRVLHDAMEFDRHLRGSGVWD